MKRGEAPETVGQVMPRLLRQLGIADRVGEGQGLLAWREAVGETIARRTQTLGIRSGILWVAVDSAVWMQELSARRRDVLRRLSELVGRGVIRDLRFVVKGTREAERIGGGLLGEGDDGKEEN